VAKQHSCGYCGIHSFYVPRSDPGKIDVNVRRLQGVGPATLGVSRFDARNWEAAMRGRVPRR